MSLAGETETRRLLPAIGPLVGSIKLTGSFGLASPDTGSNNDGWWG
jgi:hypothetical protein